MSTKLASSRSEDQANSIYHPNTNIFWLRSNLLRSLPDYIFNAKLVCKISRFLLKIDSSGVKLYSECTSIHCLHQSWAGGEVIES